MKVLGDLANLHFTNWHLVNGHLAIICRGTFHYQSKISYMYIVICLSFCMLCQYYVLFMGVTNIGLSLDKMLVNPILELII